KDNGIDPHEDVDLSQNVEFENIPGAFASDDYEYVQMFEPTASTFEEEGKGHVLASFGEEAGDIPYTVFMAKESFIEKDEDAVTSFTEAIYKSQQWVADNDAETIAEVVHPYFEDTDVEMIATAIDRYKEQDSFATDPLLKEDAWNNLQDIMNEAGELPEEAPYEKLVNTDISKDVSGKLGGRKTMSFITLKNVSHTYFSKAGYTRAIEEVNMTVEKGEFIAIIGPSGCGKSTILSSIARLLEPTKGDILVNGNPIQQEKQSIGYMLQQDYLFPWKTILENILLGPKIKQSLDNLAKEKARNLLKDVHLSHTENNYPASLSGGMRQRAALVRTLMTNPDILLFDEPFASLDYVTKLKLENTVSDMTKQYHKTTILVTHDLGEAISMSDKIILMKSNPGKIAKTFTVPEVLRKETPFFVRRNPAYQSIFDEIWNHLNDDPSLTAERRTVIEKG